MGLRLNTTMADIDRYGREQYQQAEDALIESFKYSGEGFVGAARSFKKSDGGFGDVTGNLRSSIGYFIVKNGEILIEDVEESERGTDKKTGVSVARQFINEIKQNDGLYLYGVAGMDYAKKLEDAGFNVITLQSGQAIVELKEILSEL